MAKPVASPKTTTLLLPSGSLSGWRGTTPGRTEQKGCCRQEIEPTAESISFQFVNLHVHHRVPEDNPNDFGLLDFTFEF